MKMIVKGVISRHASYGNVVEFSVNSRESVIEGYKFPISREVAFEVHPEKNTDVILAHGHVITPQTNRGEVFETAVKLTLKDEVTVETEETDDGKYLVTAITHMANRGTDAGEHFKDMKELLAENRAKNPQYF